ncbi:MAG: tryptophan 7-halogenase [Gemmatimonadaceae bacterium]|nr:tryptophan 7-halogenase [Gemmatimonadaceae bacterium]
MRTQVAIVGGGPGGSGAALHLAHHGVDTVIIEQATFPRYHIGESMTGECGALLRDLGLGDRMLAAGHPQKQGVKAYGKNVWFVLFKMRTAAGDLEDQFTWQVRRAEFDTMLLDEAVARGSTVVRGRARNVLRADDGSVIGLDVVKADGSVQRIASDVVLDASGQRTFLAHQGDQSPITWPLRQTDCDLLSGGQYDSRSWHARKPSRQRAHLLRIEVSLGVVHPFE